MAELRNKPLSLLLDLFCCEGGASVGYHRAGYDVVGIDTFNGINRKRYPYPSHQGDALDAMTTLLNGGRVTFQHHGYPVAMYALTDFAAIAASPPCQAYSVTRHSHNNVHPDLVQPVRTLLRQTKLPYVLENVVGATLKTPLTLCGTEFRLYCYDTDGQPLYLRRHRLFESNAFLTGNGGCQCTRWRTRDIGVGGVYGGGSADRNHAKNVRRGGYTPGLTQRADLMGIDWMSRRGMSQAIPPAYTEHIGRQLLA